MPASVSIGQDFSQADGWVMPLSNDTAKSLQDQKQEALPTTFDPMTYHILVERMTVYGKDKVIVRFKNGMEIQA